MIKTLSSEDKTIIDIVSALTVGGTLLNMLPAVAAVFTIIWTAIRIYETNTVQSWLGKKIPPESEDTEG